MSTTRKRGRPRKRVSEDDMDIDIIEIPQKRKTNTARNAVVAGSTAALLTGIASALMKLGYIPSDREGISNAIAQGLQFTRQKAKEQILDPEFSTMAQNVNEMNVRLDDFQNAGVQLENQFRDLVNVLERQNVITVN